MMAWYQKQQRNCRVTILIEKYNKHDRSCYGKTSRTVTQQIVLSVGTESHHYNHMNKKEHGGIRRRRSRMQKQNDFSPQKINQNQWFFLQNTQWDDDTATIHTCLGGEGFLGTMRDAKALMVGSGGRRWGGTWWGTQVGYTSFLRGPSQKAATAHFHV
jgi:hypothetical protein